MSAADWKDHFSLQSEGYSRFRPTYPEALYEWLHACAPARNLAWDCATGSGQVARGLAGHFERIVATDASRAQLAHARAPANVGFVACRADAAALRAASVDVLTIGAAMHWFAEEPFFAEVRRVMRPNGVIAAWGYFALIIGGEVDDALARVRDVVDPYWPPERRYVDSRYRTLPFPFDDIDTPEFEIRTEWTVDDLIGYLGTWSSVKNMRLATDTDPVPTLHKALREAWGPEVIREIRWPLHIRAAHVRT